MIADVEGEVCAGWNARRRALGSTGHWRPPVLMIERLMGLPDGWLRPAETPSSPKSPSILAD